MFNLIYKYRGTVARHEVAPLVEERVRYLTHCQKQGAALGTLQETAQMMLVIIEQLDLKRDGKVRFKKIAAAADRWATREPQHHNIKHARNAKSHFISVATQWLRFLGRLRSRETRQHPYTQMVHDSPIT